MIDVEYYRQAGKTSYPHPEHRSQGKVRVTGQSQGHRTGTRPQSGSLDKVRVTGQSRDLSQGHRTVT